MATFDPLQTLALRLLVDELITLIEDRVVCHERRAASPKPPRRAVKAGVDSFLLTERGKGRKCYEIQQHACGLWLTAVGRFFGPNRARCGSSPLLPARPSGGSSPTSDARGD